MNSDAREQHDQCNSSDALEFQDQTDEKQEDEKNSALTIKLPSIVKEFNNRVEGFEEDDEPTTPTSSDQRIPVAITCPPAPRKPRSVPKRNKRKTASFQRISVDLMVMINEMLAPAAVVTVPDILAGDLEAGHRVKKIKKANVTAGS